MYRRTLSNDSQVTQYTTLMIYEANVDEKWKSEQLFFWIVLKFSLLRISY